MNTMFNRRGGFDYVEAGLPNPMSNTWISFFTLLPVLALYADYIDRQIKAFMVSSLQRKTSTIDFFKTIQDKKENDLFFKTFSVWVIIGGSTIVTSKYLRRFIGNHVNKKDLKDLQDLRSALTKSHSDSQKSLYEEIMHVQKTKPSLLKYLYHLFIGGDGELSPSNILRTLIFSKEEEKFKTTQRWSELKIREYELSLNPEQQLIYKNIIETEYKIISKNKRVTALVVTGMILIAMAVIKKVNANNVNEWKNLLSNGGGTLNN